MQTPVPPKKMPPQENKPDSKKNKPKINRTMFIWLIIGLMTLYLWNVAKSSSPNAPKELNYSQFYEMVVDNKNTQQIETAVKIQGMVKGKLDKGRDYLVIVPEEDPDLIKALRENVDDFKIELPKTFWLSILSIFGPFVLFILFFYFLFYRGAAQGGGRILSFGKSRARQFSANNIKVTFNDVAGVDEAKEELQEIIEFLKEPKKFQKLGGKIPKGVLLMGPPGTGKTLLAKAVAGEAGVPFFSISGSDFVEMFVGVGASRVRDLFEQGKRSAQASGKGCIIFIDEIDAVGRQRFAGIGGGHDEREQTLNALLVEMDGFDTEEAVILIAATNRPDVLDPALLRPGRFDRQVVIDRPDIRGREGILKVHTRNIKLDKAVDFNSIARQTPGFSGADIANLVNEAALLAARKDKKAVGMTDLESSIERVMAGPERKSRVITDHEKKIIAYHESGHALLALLLPGTDPLHKVSIIPRGVAALGYTLQRPLEDRYLTAKQEIISDLTVAMGGRVAEEIIFNEITTGAHNDLAVANDWARRMVREFGMGEELGQMTFGRRSHQVFLGRDIAEDKNYSEQTAVLIDKEVHNIITTCYSRAKELLLEHVDKLKLLADKLLEKEVLEAKEVRIITGIEKTKEEQQAEEVKTQVDKDSAKQPEEPAALNDKEDLEQQAGPKTEKKMDSRVNSKDA